MSKQPECIGIILDGNRRWAKEQGLPQVLGHKAGFERAKEAARWVQKRGIKHLALFVFSTENWNRSKDEVEYLMGLFQNMVETWFTEFAHEKARIRFIGKLDMLSPALQNGIKRIEEATAVNSEFTIWICLSYGSRAEIAAAAASIQKSGEEVTEENLYKHFWSADMPDLDLVIRTSGEQRLSNFLLWQAAYAELFFIDPHWPDFSEQILDDVLAAYAERDRRHGK